MDALKSIYPEVRWKSWKFPGNWKDPKNLRRAMDELSIDLRIKEVSDWYKITNEELKVRTT